MGISVRGSESQAQPGWAWGSSPQSQGLGGGHVRTPGPGKQAGASHPAPGLSAELGPVGWSTSRAQQLTRYIPGGAGP